MRFTSTSLLYSLVASLFLTLSLSAQATDNQAAAREAYDLGAEAFLQGDVKKARKFFTRSIKFDESNIEAWRLLGEIESLDKNYIEAASAFGQVLAQDSTFSRYLYYELGDVYYKMNRPELALHYFRRFQELQDKDFGDFGLRGEQELDDEAKALDNIDSRIQAVRITLDSAEFINVTEIYNIGSPLNTESDDYFPFYSNDSRRVLLTRRNNKGDEDLILGKRKQADSNKWSISRVGSFNTKQPEGMVTLARDGERIFFTMCRNPENSQGGCDVYAGLWIDGKVQAVEPLEDYVNSGSWDSQAAISCNGRQLFFASNRPGGLGGTDLYYCELKEDGRWSRPKNLGLPVNTPGDEEAPFLSNDGQTLYFSSTGHEGLGDQDIFMSWWDKRKQHWTNVINLGPPVNSPHRELGFHLSADNQTGYFASDRPGGKGGLDIYQFRLAKKLYGEPITYVEGYVLDSITGEPQIDQKIQVNGGPQLRTNYAGRFFLCVGADEVIDFRVNNERYKPYQNSFAIPSWDNLYPYRVDILLAKDFIKKSPLLVSKAPPKPAVKIDTVERKKHIVARNLSVRFNFNDTVLVPYQRTNLDLFVKKIAGQAIVSVSIIGYADDIGTANYNLKLSEKRAESVANYLRKAGIGIDEISVKGLGSISGGARELNRKVELEIKVIEEW